MCYRDSRFKTLDLPSPISGIELLVVALPVAKVAPEPVWWGGEAVLIHSGLLDVLIGLAGPQEGTFHAVVTRDLTVRSLAVEVDIHLVQPVNPTTIHPAFQYTA